MTVLNHNLSVMEKRIQEYERLRKEFNRTNRQLWAEAVFLDTYPTNTWDELTFLWNLQKQELDQYAAENKNILSGHDIGQDILHYLTNFPDSLITKILNSI
jgi:hypothetical protein